MKNEIPLSELKDRIRFQWDELQLIEALDLTTEELVDLLSDRIEDYYDELLEKLED